MSCKSDLLSSSMTVTCIDFYFGLLVRQNMIFADITIFSNTFEWAYFYFKQTFYRENNID